MSKQAIAHLLLLYLGLIIACKVGKIPLTNHKNALLQPNKVNVLLFLETDCPISQQMTLYIRQIANAADTSQTAILLVFQPPEEKGKIKKFLTDYQLNKLPFVVNKKGKLSGFCGATVTPEAFLYNAKDSLCYHGAINNLYATVGSKRPQATIHYLQANLDSLLAQKPLPFGPQPAIGCLIL